MRRQNDDGSLARRLADLSQAILTDDDALEQTLENQAQEREAFFTVIRATISGTANGATPMIALEFGRRSVPDSFRPTFEELEQIIRGG